MREQVKYQHSEAFKEYIKKCGGDVIIAHNTWEKHKKKIEAAAQVQPSKEIK